MQVWGDEGITQLIGIIITVFAAFCIILEVSLSYLTSDFYRTKIHGEKIEYSGTYQITQKDGEWLLLESEDGERIPIKLDMFQAILYQKGDVITCSFKKREKLGTVTEFVVTDVTEKEEIIRCWK